MKKKKRLSLPHYIFIGMVLGIVVGILMQGHADIANTYIKPFGTIFLNLIKMIVVPVVLASIISGVVSMQDIKKVGRTGIKTLIFFLVTTCCAVTLGLVFANLLNVGSGYQLTGESLSYEATEAPPLSETLINIFPDNAFEPLVNADMLPVIVIALFFGAAILMAGDKGKPFGDFVDSATEVCLKVMEVIIKLSPIGVFALLVPVIAENGPDVLLPLLKLILVCYLVYILHMVLVYSTLTRFFARIPILRFFKDVMPATIMGFSTSSGMAAMPMALDCAEKMGAKRSIASFVVPLGTTINMDGTAIYQGVCSIFIAQIFGIDLTIVQQLTIIITATLASVGTAGVPGSGMIMLSMVLQSVGLPLEGIALVAGIDRILDMGRTAVNVTGNVACAASVSFIESRKEAKAASRSK